MCIRVAAMPGRFTYPSGNSARGLDLGVPQSPGPSPEKELADLAALWIRVPSLGDSPLYMLGGRHRERSSEKERIKRMTRGGFECLRMIPLIGVVLWYQCEAASLAQGGRSDW